MMCLSVTRLPSTLDIIYPFIIDTCYKSSNHGSRLTLLKRGHLDKTKENVLEWDLEILGRVFQAEGKAITCLHDEGSS